MNEQVFPSAVVGLLDL